MLLTGEKRLKCEIYVLYIQNSVRTAEGIQRSLIRKTNRMVMSGEIKAAYFKSHTV